jgi:Anaphase-promoting complex subunit 11 RING-H2 finger
MSHCNVIVLAQIYNRDYQLKLREIEFYAAMAAQPATDGPRFEVRKWSAVALWSWDIQVDNCAICRNHIMDLCIECQAGGAPTDDCSVAWGACNVRPIHFDACLFSVLTLSTRSTNTALRAGSRRARCVPWTTATGSSRSSNTDRNVYSNVFAYCTRKHLLLTYHLHQIYCKVLLEYTDSISLEPLVFDKLCHL